MDFTSLGLLILRVGFGATLAIGHGLPKLLGFSQQMHSFPDPLGIGSTLSLSLALSAEFLCSIAVVFGILTRLAALPVVITMAIAFFMVHAGDPFAKKELAFLFLLGFSTIFSCGPGAYSTDNIFRGVR